MPARAVGVADTTLRSLIYLDPPAHATVGRLIPTLVALDRAGFHAIDVWGDMPFEHSLRVLNESPWERLRAVSTHITRTPIQMGLRGTSLVGYRPYPPALVDEFVKQAVDCGVRSFVVQDALNDLRNLEIAANAVKATGAGLCVALVHAAGSDGALENTVAMAQNAARLDPDALCLKTASALGPNAGRKVVKALRAAVSCPLHVDLDNAGGLAAIVSALCIEAGAEVVYASATPSWIDPAAVPVTVVLAALIDAGIVTPVDAGAVAAVADALASLTAATAGSAALIRASEQVDWRERLQVPAAVAHQVAERLHEQGALERLPEVVGEMLRVRAEIGMPTLAQPLAHVAATQAVLNVLYGRRWQVVPDEMKAFLRGAFGRPPTQPAEEVLRMALGHGEDEASGSVPGPSFSQEQLRTRLDGLAESSEDLLLEALAPGEAARFLERRRAARRVDSPAPTLTAEGTIAVWEDEWQDLGPQRVRELISLLEASNVDELTIENKGTRVSLRKASHGPGEAMAVGAGLGPAGAGLAPETGPGTQAVYTAHLLSSSADEDAVRPVLASMVGTFHKGPSPDASAYVQVGQHVEKGDVLCILEAMKLMNEVIAEAPGRVAAVLAEEGDAVEYGQPLFLIEPSAG
ncbi:MAG: acetyl-CoA carboxylase biotin carboxyl carrier protein [bacterium]